MTKHQFGNLSSEDDHPSALLRKHAAELSERLFYKSVKQGCIVVWKVKQVGICKIEFVDSNFQN